MEYSWRLKSCPSCNKIYKFSYEKFLDFAPATTGMGPVQVQCAHCGEVFDSGLQEWRVLKPAKKLWFTVLSLFYSLILGFVLTLPTLAIIGVLIHNTDRDYPPNRWTIAGMIVFAVVIMGVQLLRIELSIRRSEFDIQKPMRVSFWTWQTNFQVYGMIVTLFSFLVFALTTSFFG